MEYISGSDESSVSKGFSGQAGVFLPQLISWRESLRDLPPEAVYFEKYLFTALSKVLFGDKPAELLLLRADKSFGSDLDTLLERARILTCSWGLHLFLLGIVPAGARIVVYQREKVNKALRNARNTPLFIDSGYSNYALAEDFFGEIARRWEEKGEIPHEIAIALGYPIKDVVGYLGLTPLKYIGNYGWRVFGTEEPSRRLRDQYDFAKKMALEFLEELGGEKGQGDRLIH